MNQEKSRTPTRVSKYLYTKDQLVGVLKAWGSKLEPPKKGQTHTLDFPNNFLNRGKVRWTDKKSTYGKRLYEIVLFRSQP